MCVCIYVCVYIYVYVCMYDFRYTRASVFVYVECSNYQSSSNKTLVQKQMKFKTVCHYEIC